MFRIGEFARHGRVSVRMPRHYDAIGLRRPASTDPATGYRLYRAGQLAELNRVIALKDLGCPLQQVQAILKEKVTAVELRGMLKLRRAEIQAQIGAETTRLSWPVPGSLPRVQPSPTTRTCRQVTVPSWYTPQFRS